jgi:hypothetical protein
MSQERKLARLEMKRRYKAMKPTKLKTILVTLADGQELYVHSPRTSDLGTFLRALPPLQTIAEAFKSMKAEEEGLQGVPIILPDSALEGFFPLLAIMSDITVEEFKSLPLIPDGFQVLEAFSLFMPKNAPAAPTAGVESSPTGPQNTSPDTSSGKTTE